MLIVCVLSYFVKKIYIKCRNHELSLLPIGHNFSVVLLEGEVTSPYCQGLAEPLEEGKKLYINGPGHMTKMAAMLMYGKHLQKSSPTELIKLGMEHYVLKLYKVYINNDPELTLTYFTTM